MQVVFAGLRFDVRGLVGELTAGGVDRLARLLEHTGDRMLGEPVDLHCEDGGGRRAFTVARSRRMWPSPMGDEMYSTRLQRDAARCHVERRGGCQPVRR